MKINTYKELVDALEASEKFASGLETKYRVEENATAETVSSETKRHIRAALSMITNGNDGGFAGEPHPDTNKVVGLEGALRLQRVFHCQADRREASALHNYASVKIELTELRLKIASAISQGTLPETFYRDLPK